MERAWSTIACGLSKLEGGWLALRLALFEKLAPLSAEYA
jgi:hypothetical protein